jgi:hypothetical protein
MNRIITNVVLIVIYAGFFVACNVSNNDDESDDTFTDGIVNDVWDFISEDDLSTLENTLEVPIYRSENPPNIDEIFGGTTDDSNTFLMNPFVMVTSSVPTDQDRGIPRSFNDLYINLSN